MKLEEEIQKVGDRMSICQFNRRTAVTHTPGSPFNQQRVISTVSYAELHSEGREISMGISGGAVQL